MTIDQQLALRGRTLDTATPVRQMQQDQNANAESAQRVLAQHLQNLNTRDQSRLTSTIAGAAQLGVFLENNDLNGARDFLMRRRQQLQTRMGGGEAVDTQDTDAAIQMLESGNIDELKNNVNGLIAAGRVYGILDSDPTRSGVGGSTGELIDRLIQEDNGIDTVQAALEHIKGGAGAAGRNAADISSGGQANFAKQSGTNQSDLLYKPQIAAETNRQGTLGTREGQNLADYNDFMASVPALERTANRLYQVADRATYTLSGRSANAFQRELGFDPGDDAAAREYYTNLVRTEILPILKQTFGAQFTEKEGEWLLATLGDINKSPREKQAALQARVESWQNLAETMGRRAGVQPEPTFQNFPPQQQQQGEGDRVRIRDPQSGRVGSVPRSQAQAAQQQGYEILQ